jgi:hypothetical protein
MKFERRLSSGFGLTVAYTFSKNVGVEHGLSDPRFAFLDRGPLENDATHNFVVSPIWYIPVGAGHGFLNMKGPVNQILGGWQVNGILTMRSGFPLTPTLSGTDLLHYNGFKGADRPDRTCSGALSDPSANEWFDKSCFTLPIEPTTPGALLRDGNSGPGILRGPGAFGLDSGISKTFPLTERIGLDFRAEFFNIFNHPILAMPNAVIAPGGNSPPAQITSTVSLPRIIQFALKLHF